MFGWGKKDKNASGDAAASSTGNASMGVLAVSKPSAKVALPTDLDERFDRMLKDIGVPAAAKERMLAMPAEQRWAMLQAHEVKASSATSVEAAKTPEMYIKQLLQPDAAEVPRETLESLRVQLSTCGREWLDKFFFEGGLDAIAHAMLHARDRLEHVKICLDALKATMKSEEDLRHALAAERLVKAIAFAFGFGRAGCYVTELEDIAERADESDSGEEPHVAAVLKSTGPTRRTLRTSSTAHLSLSSMPSMPSTNRILTAQPSSVSVASAPPALKVAAPTEQQAQKLGLETSTTALKLLVAIARSSFEGHSAVLDAWDAFRVTFEEEVPFVTLISALRAPLEGPQVSESYLALEQWSMRCAIVVLVNDLIDAPSIEQRVTVRGEFCIAGLVEAVEHVHEKAAALIPRTAPESAVSSLLRVCRTSIEVFRLGLQQDNTEALELGEGVMLSDPNMVFSAVAAGAAASANYDVLMSILLHLLVIPSFGDLAKSTWARAEAAVHGAVIGTDDGHVFGFSEVNLLRDLQNELADTQRAMDALRRSAISPPGAPVPPARSPASPTSPRVMSSAENDARIGELNTKIKQLEDSKAAAVAAMTSAQAEVDDLRARLQQHSDKTDEFQRSIDDLRTQLDRSKAEVDDLQAALEQERSSAQSISAGAAGVGSPPSPAGILMSPAGGPAAMPASAPPQGLSSSSAAIAAAYATRRAQPIPIPAARPPRPAGYSPLPAAGRVPPPPGPASEVAAIVAASFPAAPRPGAGAGLPPRAALAAALAARPGLRPAAPAPSAVSGPPRPGVPPAPGGPPRPVGAPGPAAPRPMPAGPSPAGGPPRPPGAAAVSVTQAGGPPRPPGAPAVVGAPSGPPRPPGAAPASMGPATAPARPAGPGPLAAGPGAPRPGRPGAGPAAPAAGGVTTAPGAGRSASAPPVSAKPKKVAPPASCKLRGLFWTKIPDSSVDNSIFRDLTDSKVTLDLRELEEWFKVNADTAAGSRAATSATADAGTEGTKKKGPVLLLDGKRQQNAGIALARVRMKNADIRAAVLAADVNVLTLDKLQMLATIIPTAEELQMLVSAFMISAVISVAHDRHNYIMSLVQHDYDGDKLMLGNLEQFFLAIADIPRYEQRLLAMLFQLRLGQLHSDAEKKLTVIRAGIESIRNSTALRGMLEHVLAVGNFLNGDNAARGGAYGFRLDTLKKLSTVKSQDNKYTLVDYLARLALDAGRSRGLHRLATDLAPLALARAESLEAVMNDVKAIERGLQQVKTQVELASTGAKIEGDTFAAVMAPFAQAAAKTVTSLGEAAASVSQAFKDLVSSFQEDSTDTLAFFPLFHDFASDFGKALEREEERRAKAAKAATPSATPSSAAEAKGTERPLPALPTGKARADNVVDGIFGDIQSAAAGQDSHAIFSENRRRAAEKRTLDVPGGVQVSPAMLSMLMSQHSGGLPPVGAGGVAGTLRKHTPRGSRGTLRPARQSSVRGLGALSPPSGAGPAIGATLAPKPPSVPRARKPTNVAVETLLAAAVGSPK